MDEIKSESELAQCNDLIVSVSSDEWESDEESEKDIKYRPLPQDIDTIENGESLDVNLSDDNADIDEVH